jgi:leucyl aminopeptidase
MMPMPDRLTVRFAALSETPEGPVVLLAGDGPALGDTGAALDKQSGGAILRAVGAGDYKGRKRSALEILSPARLEATRLCLIGLGKPGELSEEDWVGLGGFAYAQVTQRKATAATLIAEHAGASERGEAEIAADLAYGALLRSYQFDKYRTKKSDDDKGEAGEAPAKNGLQKLTVLCADPHEAMAQFARRQAVAQGTFLARDLVNEPANILGPVEFAERAKALSRLGVEVEVLDVGQLEELKMGALLGVAQGSVRPARVVVMQWHGAAGKRGKPVCFVGKGVVFDTGGISIKPAGGMEDMKGDMAGAACVTGLMQAFAERKAKVNAVGLIGLVENMPSGTAQRPGDIVTSMSGQTIEVLNTDAEGRLVLADVVWYAQERFKPRFIVDLATLTGAIIVALGKEHAGLFCNDDKLALQLAKAGDAVGEKVWRMPLGRAYDKLIDSRNADMKNIGGRYGGAITGAQFIQRFVRNTPWAHLDIAGTAMDSARNDVNTSWASGWGVRLLDRLVADHYES